MTNSCEQQIQQMQQQERENETSKNFTSSSSSSRTAGSSSGSDNASAPSSSSKAVTKQSSGSRRRKSKQQKALSPVQQALAKYVPDYLKPFVNPYHGEYCYTPIFRARFIAQLMAEGFLPVATQAMLLPKLHLQRSVIDLANNGLHISKSVRKKSKRFTITVNQQFHDVIQGCHDQHGSHCWLYPPLVAAFREIFEAGQMDASPPVAAAQTGKPFTQRNWPVRLYTVEVWNEKGALAGGEIGYTVGSIYTSLTGFTKEDSAGSVQLAALGRLLMERGFHMWDLGMDMDYKRGIGSQLMPRATFVGEVHRVRETQGHLVLPVGAPAQNCKDVIDRNQPASQAAAQQQGSDRNSNQSQVLQASKKKSSPESPKNDGTCTSTLSSDSKYPMKNPSSRTPPRTETEAPIKKRVRKSDSAI